MRKIAGVVGVLLVALGSVLAVLSSKGSPAASAAGPPTSAAKPVTTTKTYAMKVAGMTRSWEVISSTALSAKAPVIVMLSGLGATVSSEVSRDQLTPYASAAKAELVYPVAYEKSWNAIGCCSFAGKAKINDLAFIKALVAKIDPGHKRPVYVIGFSNGARLAYRIACTDPYLFDAYAMVKGGPLPRCVVSKPVKIEQLASTDDLEVPYSKPDKDGGLSALAIVAELRKADKCPTKASTVTHTGNLTLSTWTTCTTGKRVGFAVWSAGKHAFPRPPVANPGAAPVIWAFFTNTKPAPLP